MNIFNEQETLITLMNKLFDPFKRKNIKNLNELTNERFYKELLLEIEPKLEKIGGRIEINNDNNFGIRYANIVSILNCLEKYLLKSPEKERFSPTTLELKNQIIINDLLKNDKDQIIILIEIILFMSSISSKKDYYLDRITELDDIKYVKAFFHHIEKYILLEGKLDETLNHSLMDKSVIVYNNFSRLKEEFDKEKDNLIKTLKENEKIIYQLNEKNEVLEKSYFDLEMRFKDKEREYEITKSHQNLNLKLQEEMYKDNITNSELISQITAKEIELADIKRESELNIKRLTDENKKLKEKVDSHEDKTAECKSLKSQNEKLNLKIKELSINRRDVHTDYEDLKNNLETKNKQVEALLKEKQTYIPQIEKLNKDIVNLKDKLRQTEIEKKKYELEMQEAKRECSRLENAKYNNMYNILNNNLNNNLQMNINNISEVKKHSNNINVSEINTGMEDGADSMILDDLKDLNIKNKNLISERDLNDLLNEKNELKKLYNGQMEEIHKLVEEKDKLLNTIDTLNTEIEKKKSEKDRFGIEKEKLEIQLQKYDLDNQKLKISIERMDNDRKKLEDEIKDLNDKFTFLNSEITLKNKENENLKNLLNNNQMLAEKIVTEKQNILKEYNLLQGEIEKTKNQTSQPSEKKKVISNPNKANAVNISYNSNNANITNNNFIQHTEFQTELNLLKNEIQTLKLNITQKDELIKNLKDKLKTLEGNELTDRLTKDLSKNKEDLDFYKRSYEEQKSRVNKEHEMISSSLYDLALQFMSLKNELQKKMNSENNIKK